MMNKTLVNTVIIGLATSLLASYLWDKYHKANTSEGFSITQNANGSYTHNLYDFINATPYLDASEQNGVIFN